jgi:hypothetical protein
MERALLALRKFGVVAVMAGAGLTAMAQESRIVVHALNGKNGKPIANEHLVIFTGASAEDVREHKNHIELRTDAKGTALLSVDDRATSHIQVWVDWHVLCQEAPNSKSYSLEDILKRGLTTPNNCGRVEQAVAPKHLVVFARPAHFWEKMHQ